MQVPKNFLQILEEQKEGVQGPHPCTSYVSGFGLTPEKDTAVTDNCCGINAVKLCLCLRHLLNQLGREDRQDL